MPDGAVGLASEEMRGPPHLWASEDTKQGSNPLPLPAMPFAAVACCAPPSAATASRASSSSRSNLDRVRSIAAHYRDLGLPLEDLVQEGAIGLLDAIDHYDPPRCFLRDVHQLPDPAGGPERTHRQGALDPAPEAGRRAPQGDRARRGEARRSCGRPDAGDSGDRGRHRPPCRDHSGARSAGLAPVSLDQPALPDGSPLEGLVADPRAADPELKLLEHEQTKLLAAALADLPERQRRIVSCKWGIGEAQMPNRVLASKLALSPRRTQTIGRDALYELRKALDP